MMEKQCVSKDFDNYFSGEKCLTAHSLEAALLLMNGVALINTNRQLNKLIIPKCKN